MINACTHLVDIIQLDVFLDLVDQNLSFQDLLSLLKVNSEFHRYLSSEYFWQRLAKHLKLPDTTKLTAVILNCRRYLGYDIQLYNTDTEKRYRFTAPLECVLVAAKILQDYNDWYVSEITINHRNRLVEYIKKWETPENIVVDRLTIAHKHEKMNTMMILSQYLDRSTDQPASDGAGIGCILQDEYSKDFCFYRAKTREELGCIIGLIGIIIPRFFGIDIYQKINGILVHENGCLNSDCDLNSNWKSGGLKILVGYVWKSLECHIGEEWKIPVRAFMNEDSQ